MNKAIFPCDLVVDDRVGRPEEDADAGFGAYAVARGC